jgi:anti-anti-sigma factor
MDINVKKDNEGGIIAELSGRLDTNSAPLLQRVFDDMPEEDLRKAVVLDLAETTYVSSAGLRVLLLLQKKITAAGGSLSVGNLCEQVREVFDMTGFSAILKVTASA